MKQGRFIPFGFKVYKLKAVDEEQWVKMEGLDGQILFLGDNCFSSVSAQD